MDRIDVKNIFAAVSDKSVLDPLLKLLDPKSTKFWGTEGTVKYLKNKGFKAESIVSGFDFDGRVKSLDRENFIRVLADRSNKEHLSELRKLKLEPIDLVIVDLYAPDTKNFPESMDIGGQALIRAAVKNYKNVALAYDAKSMDDLANHLQANQGMTLFAFRLKQAKSAAKFIAKRCNLEAKYFK
ncbi:MAG: hypothetical protein AAB639_00825 [Patescibacteria group bacterium]